VKTGKDYPSGTDNPTVPLLLTASRLRAANPESNIDRWSAPSAPGMKVSREKTEKPEDRDFSGYA
jgi:hypothetical protein